MNGDRKNAVLKGFIASYGELLRHLSRRLGNNADADDILQDSYLRLQNIPADADIRNPHTYLRRMVNNLAVDRLRSRQSRERYITVQEDFDLADECPSPERAADYSQRLAHLERAVLRLPGRQRQVLMMSKFEGMSYGEIAAELGISISAVENLIMKALANCRDRLGDLIE